jgi:decaprenylphospho-beta-D-erythro-pentofuranosid-2-ulose 2-reductase
MNSAIIIGSSSGVGRALAYYLSTLNFRLLLISRSDRDLEVMSNDLFIRYKNDTSWLSYDFSNLEEIDDLVNYLTKSNKKYSQIYICSGKILDNDSLGIDKKSFQSMINTNYGGISYFINKLAMNYDVLGQVAIVVISSIAVARPRGNNIIYSSSKSAIDFYCRALQHKLWNTNFSIKLVRLGYTSTSMTYGKKLLFPLIEPASVAKKLYKIGISKRSIVYIPAYWRVVSLIINLLPWFIYKKITF